MEACRDGEGLVGRIRLDNITSWKWAHVHVEPAHVQMNPAFRASPKRDACTPQVKWVAAIPAIVTRSAEDKRLWHQDQANARTLETTNCRAG